MAAEALPRAHLLKTTVLIKSFIKQLEELRSREVSIEHRYSCNVRVLGNAYSNLEHLPSTLSTAPRPNGINRDYNVWEVIEPNRGRVFMQNYQQQYRDVWPWGRLAWYTKWEVRWETRGLRERFVSAPWLQALHFISLGPRILIWKWS